MASQVQSNPLAGIEIPDDDTRPKAPDLPDVQPHQRQAGLHLKMIHNHHRKNMRTIRQLLDDIEKRGEISIPLEEVTQPLQDMEQAYKQFGALCGQHCQIIHGHHAVEDAHLFPALSAKAKTLSKVIDRLKAEHEIVHQLLVRIIAALDALFADTSDENFTTAKVLYDALDKLLASHFHYEESSIGDAIGFYDVQL